MRSRAPSPGARSARCGDWTPGGVFAVKEPFDPPEESATDDEATFQDLGVAAGVPATHIVRTSAGRVLADVRGTAIRVYEWVELCAPDRDLDPVAVAGAVARLHQIGYVGRNGVHPWYGKPVGLDEWVSLVDDLTEVGAPFADELAARLDELVALERLLEPPTELWSCHRDLFADNALATADGGVCIIDWENSGLADPSQELAVLLFEFAGQNPRRARDLYSAYREFGCPGVVTRPESFSMAVAQLGNVGRYAARQWLADPIREQRKRNTGRVQEFLRDGITLGMIDLLLEAVVR